MYPFRRPTVLGLSISLLAVVHHYQPPIVEARALLPSSPPPPGKPFGTAAALAKVYSRCSVPNTVALTFDDGPWIYLQDIVNALDGAGARGTFFFNGNNWGCIYDQAMRTRVQYAYTRGHQIASHTWGHKDLTKLTFDQLHDEMWRVEQALWRIAGAYPAFMRPPFGNYNNLVLNVSGMRGQSVAIWDFDSEDSIGASANASKAFYDDTISQHPNTILTLNHETIETTAHSVLPYAINRLKAAGYKLVTLADCLGVPAYQNVTAPGSPDPTWVC